MRKGCATSTRFVQIARFIVEVKQTQVFRHQVVKVALYLAKLFVNRRA